MLFSVQKEHRHWEGWIPVLLLVAMLAVFCSSASSLEEGNSNRQKELLENALERSITQCYALEGSDPSSLSYLEENYGLTYSKEHYYIDYQYIGSNLRPDTTIIERD